MAGIRVRVLVRRFNTEPSQMFLGENMNSALAALARNNRTARPAQVLPVPPARKAGPQGYTTGDILAMLIEVGALEDLGLTDRLKRPAPDASESRGHRVDRLL